tara:strand:+ start:303 stop:602 length:300 start_codon:yes stop_codon:yes gene_type:complete
MSSRYIYTKIKKNSLGRQVLKPTIYPTIPIEDSDVFIYPVYGDRLDTLAHKYYKDSTLWWIIAKANNLDNAVVGLDPTRQIRVPLDIEPILIKLENMAY